MLERHIDSALKIYEQSEGNFHASGRAKVITTQLNSTTREEICHLQGIGYSFSALFVDIDPVLLPDLLALASSAHGQNELYCMLLTTGPELFSLIPREMPAHPQRQKERGMKWYWACGTTQIFALSEEHHRCLRDMDGQNEADYSFKSRLSESKWWTTHTIAGLLFS